MLRINQFRLPGHNPEEGRVELVDAAHDRTRRDIVVEAHEPLAIANLELAGAETGDSFLARFQIVPKLSDIAGARKSSRHPDDGDASWWVLHGDTAHEPARISRRRRRASCCLRARSPGDSREGSSAVARVTSFTSEAMVGCSNRSAIVSAIGSAPQSAE